MSLSVASRVSFKAPIGRRVVARAEDESTNVAKTGTSEIAAVDAPRVGGNLFFPDDASLAYLDGSTAGDLGFDPLGLLDPSTGAGGFMSPEWLKYAEVLNGRWAMLGTAGCIAPELLGKLGVIPESTAVVWWKSGVIPPAGTPDNLYFIDPWALFWIEVCLMQFAELRRIKDFENPGCMANSSFFGLQSIFAGSGEPAYPGGAFFNFAGFCKTEEETKEMRTKELQNGRLAMLSFFGYGAQAVITGKGPVENIADHLANPTANNIIGNFGKIGGL